MTRENIEVVRQAYERFNRRDIEGVLALGTDDFELRLPASYPEGAASFRGRDGLQRWVAMVQDTWSEWRFDVEQLIEANEQVVALVRIVAQGGSSGVPVDREVAHVWSVRDGKPSTVSVYLDRAEAREAVRLREQANLPEDR
jgi:ketosteroid isomerase-like protein